MALGEAGQAAERRRPGARQGGGAPGLRQVGSCAGREKAGPSRFVTSRPLPLLGWGAGIGWAIWAASLTGFQNSGYLLDVAGWVIPAYIGIHAVVINLVVAVITNLVARKLRVGDDADATQLADYSG